MEGKRQRPKRRHHHVWQQYLKAWSQDGAIWCLQDGRIFSTGTPTVAAEKDFYKLQRLTNEDETLLKALFARAHPLAKRNHTDLVDMLMAPFKLADQLKESKHRARIDEAVEEYAFQVLEDYHARIEASFIPSLKSALNENVEFYKDERVLPFLDYICTQYMRTKGVKERAIALCEADKSADLTRVWNVLIHMFSTNIGASLYVERDRRKLILVKNGTDVTFITGDQPAINLKGNRPHPPESLSIYYPISPRQALILTDVDEEPLIPADGLTAYQVSMLNKRVYVASYRQLFAQSEMSLRQIWSESHAGPHDLTA